MPYKHENTNKTIVQSYHAYSGDRAEAMLEIEETYAKAKAFNEIMDIYIKQGFVDYIEDVLIIWEDE